MEEKIYQQLKEGLKNSSLSEITIRSKAQRLAKRYDESTFTSDVLKDAIEDLTVVNGQLNKEIADAVKTQKEKLEAEYKAKYSNSTPNPDPNPDTKDPKDTKDPFGKVAEEWTKKLQEVDNLKKLVEERLQNEKFDRLKQEASKILKEKHNADRDYVLGNAISKVKVEDADTPETLAEKIVPIYDAEYKMAYGDGVAPRMNIQGGDTQKADALKTLVEKRKAEMKKP